MFQHILFKLRISETFQKKDISKFSKEKSTYRRRAGEQYKKPDYTKEPERVAD